MPCIGAGVGYYTAILARLVGRRGRVTAIEFDPSLAERARKNLADERNTQVVQGDGYPKWRGVPHRATRRRIHGRAHLGRHPCEGMRDAASEAALASAFPNGRVGEVRRLYRRDDLPEEDCWLRGPGWCLGYR